MRALVFALTLAACVSPVSARLWKPTPAQQATDYLTINHNKGADGHVIVGWMASPTITSPTMQPLLDKYVVISIVHTRTQPAGPVTYDDVQGVQVTDASGQPLKEVTGDAIPPALVGITASANASIRQTTQGRGKMFWGIYEAGSVSPCLPGKLQVTYDGETYNYDTPLPGCGKN